MKDETTAQNLRYEGNDKYKQRKFTESLIAYNKSLCFSPLDSENVSFVYANRSAVYFEMHQYQKSFENIKLALFYNYPDTDRLLLREAKCKELFGSQSHSKNLKFFKLSHPVNEMIPFIISNLELREDDKFGRHIVTTEDLNPGDIIAKEDACFKTLEIGARFSRCAFCLSFNKLSLIPCDRGCSCSKFLICILGRFLRILNYSSDVLQRRM